jgi:hypothetical protein
MPACPAVIHVASAGQYSASEAGHGKASTAVGHWGVASRFKLSTVASEIRVLLC